MSKGIQMTDEIFEKAKQKYSETNCEVEGILKPIIIDNSKYFTDYVSNNLDDQAKDNITRRQESDLSNILLLKENFEEDINFKDSAFPIPDDTFSTTEFQYFSEEDNKSPSNKIEEHRDMGDSFEQGIKESSSKNVYRPDCNKIAEYMLKKISFIFYLGSLYYYSEPIYRRINDHEGKTLIRRIVPKKVVEKLSDYQLGEVLRLIKTTPEIQKEDRHIKMPDNLICFKNKVYDINTGELKGHTQRNYFFSYIDVEYTPTFVCHGKVFEDYINTCTGGDDELKNLIMEAIGYIIANSIFIKKLFIIIGVPDSGKTTFGEFIKSLIGEENCCHVPLQDISKRFQVAELCGKKLCLNMDLPDSPIKDTGIIKMLTGNDLIPAERKYEPPFSFRNEAKLLYGCNNLPYVESNETAKAFYNRLVIIPFNISIPPEKQDKDIINKLISEKNYIVHKSLKALNRLKANNYVFSSSIASDSIKKKYINNSNNVLEFVNEICFLGDKNSKEACVYCNDLYNSYKKFCLCSGYSEEEVFNYKKFCNIIVSNFTVTHTRFRDGNGQNLHGFKGIGIKSI